MVWHERGLKDFELVNELAWGRYGPTFWPVLVWKDENYLKSDGERSLEWQLRAQRGRVVVVSWLGDARQESLLRVQGELKSWKDGLRRRYHMQALRDAEPRERRRFDLAVDEGFRLAAIKSSSQRFSFFQKHVPTLPMDDSDEHSGSLVTNEVSDGEDYVLSTSKTGRKRRVRKIDFETLGKRRRVGSEEPAGQPKRHKVFKRKIDLMRELEDDTASDNHVSQEEDGTDEDEDGSEISDQLEDQETSTPEPPKLFGRRRRAGSKACARRSRMSTSSGTPRLKRGRPARPVRGIASVPTGRLVERYPSEQKRRRTARQRAREAGHIVYSTRERPLTAMQIQLRMDEFVWAEEKGVEYDDDDFDTDDDNSSAKPDGASRPQATGLVVAKAVSNQLEHQLLSGRLSAVNFSDSETPSSQAKGVCSVVVSSDGEEEEKKVVVPSASGNGEMRASLRLMLTPLEENDDDEDYSPPHAVGDVSEDEKCYGDVDYLVDESEHVGANQEDFISELREHSRQIGEEWVPFQLDRNYGVKAGRNAAAVRYVCEIIKHATAPSNNLRWAWTPVAMGMMVQAMRSAVGQIATCLEDTALARLVALADEDSICDFIYGIVSDCRILLHERTDVVRCDLPYTPYWRPPTENEEERMIVKSKDCIHELVDSKVLGYVLSRRGIKVDPDPRNCGEGEMRKHLEWFDPAGS